MTRPTEPPTVNQAIGDWTQRFPETVETSLHDAVLNNQLTFIRHMLRLADMIMDDEGVAPEVRAKVVRGILYGSPSPSEAQIRIEDAKREIHRIEHERFPRP